MIEHLIDMAKLAIAVAVGTFIGSYIMEWRMKRIIKPYIPLLLVLLGSKGVDLKIGEKKSEKNDRHDA